MSLEKLFETSFDEILTVGRHTREVKISDNLHVTMKPLPESDVLSIRLSIPDQAKKDALAYAAAESFEILSRAIISINGSSIEDAAKEELSKAKDKAPQLTAEELARNTTRKWIGKLPPKVINYLSREYNELIKVQYESIKSNIGEEIENF